MNYLVENLAEVPIGEKFKSPLGVEGGQTLGSLVSIILQGAIVLAGIILLFLLVFGGISMIAGAGSNNPEQAAKGRQAATAAVIGFVIVFAAYWVVRLIELISGVDFITAPGL